MGSTYDDEMKYGGTTYAPYCHGPSYFYSTQTELVAGADPHDEQRSLFGGRWGLSDDHLYTDYREMLEAERPDLVSVTTTATLRSTIVQDVARSGAKAIWAEKPISISLAEADAMVEACRDNGVIFAVNTARRWMPSYTEAKHIMDSGDLGAVLQVDANFPCGLSHNGSHMLDIIRFLAGGDVEWVFGEMESDEAAAADHDLSGHCYLAFDNGVRAFARTTDCGTVAQGRDRRDLRERADHMQGGSGRVHSLPYGPGVRGRAAPGHAGGAVPRAHAGEDAGDRHNYHRGHHPVNRDGRPAEGVGRGWPGRPRDGHRAEGVAPARGGQGRAAHRGPLSGHTFARDISRRHPSKGPAHDGRAGVGRPEQAARSVGSRTGTHDGGGP